MSINTILERGQSVSFPEEEMNECFPTGGQRVPSAHPHIVERLQADRWRKDDAALRSLPCIRATRSLVRSQRYLRCWKPCGSCVVAPTDIQSRIRLSPRVVRLVHLTLHRVVVVARFASRNCTRPCYGRARTVSPVLFIR